MGISRPARARGTTSGQRAIEHATVASVASAVAAMAQNASPIGTWQTIDDHTGQPKALVQITQDGSGTLSGKIIKGLSANDNPDRRCTACTDARKDQLMLGMTIINDMKKDSDGWDGGQILDPDPPRAGVRTGAGGEAMTAARAGGAVMTAVAAAPPERAPGEGGRVPLRSEAAGGREGERQQRRTELSLVHEWILESAGQIRLSFFRSPGGAPSKLVSGTLPM